jgi:pimeloyl-ACP methyl ester carboxylesterase
VSDDGRPERFATFYGRQIAYAVNGSGPDALLLHGFASDHTGNWVRPGIVDALVASGRRVIAYDARGHGASDKPHEVDACENNAMVRDAQALLDRLAVTAVDVVGYSMGSIMSSRLVGAAPRRARSGGSRAGRRHRRLSPHRRRSRAGRGDRRVPRARLAGVTAVQPGSPQPSWGSRATSFAGPTHV